MLVHFTCFIVFIVGANPANKQMTHSLAKLYLVDLSIIITSYFITNSVGFLPK